MPYPGAKLHGRGLKIRLCGLPVSTGALNAVEIYVKKKRKILSEDARDLLERYRKRAAFEKIALLGPALDITTEWGPRTAFGNPA